MNDKEEVRFSMLQANEIVLTSHRLVDACRTPERAALFKNSFIHLFNQFENEHVLDIYVFCLSNHSREDDDGKLSMWRAYGANGNGVAIVFDTAQFNISAKTSLVINQVSYGTKEARLDWLRQTISTFEVLLTAANIPPENLHTATS